MAKNALFPHDRVTRSLMKHPKVIEEFFRNNLPEKIKEAIDFSSLQLRNDSLICDELKLQNADLLFDVKFNGKPGFLYLLVEHASKPDPMLPFRMLKYVIAVMEQHLKTAENKPATLPLVYPVVFYTGKRPYTHSMDVFDLFHKDERELAKEILMQPYYLTDLTQIADEQLRNDLWYGTMALALKHIHDRDIVLFVRDIVESLKKLERHGENSYIETIIRYLMHVGRTENQKGFFHVIEELETVGEEKIMTLIEHFIERVRPQLEERFRQQGLEKGIEKGIEQGLEKEKKSKLAIVNNMLAQGMNLETISSLTGLSMKEIKGLMH